MEDGPAGQITKLYRRLSPARRNQLAIIFLLTPLTALAEMLSIATLVAFLSLLVPGRGPSTTLDGVLRWLGWAIEAPEVAIAAGLFAIAAALTAALRLVLSWHSLRFTADLGHELNVEIQRRTLLQPYLYHASSHSSRLIASLEKVEELVVGLVLSGIRAICAAVISVALLTALFLVDALSASAALALIAILYGGALLLVRPKLRRRSEFVASAHQQRIRQSQENSAGIRDIILDQSQAAHLQQFSALDEPYMRSRTDISFLSSAPRFLVEGLGLGLIALLAIAVATRPGGITVALPTLGALALGALRLLPLASQVYGGWVDVQAGRPVLREVNALLDLPIRPQGEHAASLPLSRVLRFDNVSFHYPGRESPALTDLTMTILPASRVAIVGRSGSGKSTFADLLMGLLEPTDGQIRIDGELLAGGALAAWQRSVAHVPQSIFVADTTFGRNISLATPNEPIDMDRLKRAAASAQLDEFVESLPEGYDTPAGERGVRLSGGQRQRLALARALYKRPRLLVLDEATSALDDQTEAAVLGALDELQAEGCTIVIIAHRLSTVERCDNIFMLEQGMLVQSGSFAELFGRLNRLQGQGEL